MNTLKKMTNVYFYTDTILVGGGPFAEKTYSKYVYGLELTLVIWEKRYVDGGKGAASARAYNSNNIEIFCNDNLDDFFEELEARGYQIGSHESEGVELTSLGEQEIDLGFFWEPLV